MVQFVRINVLAERVGSLCVLFQKEEEFQDHLFVSCEVILNIWKKVWLWICGSLEVDLEDFVDFFHNFLKIKSFSKIHTGVVIWLSTVWIVWLNWNKVIFKEESFSFSECTTKIIFNAWSWMCTFYKRNLLCNFYY